MADKRGSHTKPAVPNPRKEQESITVGERPAFGSVGKVLGLKHTAIITPKETLSVGNPSTEPASNYHKQTNVPLPKGVKAKQVEDTQRKELAKFKDLGKGQYAKEYLRGNCADRVRFAAEKNGVELPKDVANQGFNDPSKGRAMDRATRSVGDPFSGAGVQAEELPAKALRILKAPHGEADKKK